MQGLKSLKYKCPAVKDPRMDLFYYSASLEELAQDSLQNNIIKQKIIYILNGESQPKQAIEMLNSI